MNNQNKIYNQDNNTNRRRLIPQDRPRVNNNMNVNYGPNPNQNPNSNLNYKNYQNRNIVARNNENNTELGKAFIIIQRELKKKDNRIIELEKKVQELTRKLNSLTNNNNMNYSKNTSMLTPSKEVQNNYYKNIEINKGMVNNMNDNMYNIGYNNQNLNAINMRNNIRSNSQQKAFQINNLNYNSDSENVVKRFQGYDNLSHSNDNSVLTYNGIHGNSKKEVKDYLKEVKAKIEPKKFKEFIKNIKLLTSKNEFAPKKEVIIENMRNLFGIEHLDLFSRFETIIGANK